MGDATPSSTSALTVRPQFSRSTALRAGQVIIAARPALLVPRLYGSPQRGKGVPSVREAKTGQPRIAPAGARRLPLPRSGKPNRDILYTEILSRHYPRLTTHVANGLGLVWSPDGRKSSLARSGMEAFLRFPTCRPQWIRQHESALGRDNLAYDGPQIKTAVDLLRRRGISR